MGCGQAVRSTASIVCTLTETSQHRESNRKPTVISPTSAHSDSDRGSFSPETTAQCEKSSSQSLTNATMSRGAAAASRLQAPQVKGGSLTCVGCRCRFETLFSLNFGLFLVPEPRVTSSLFNKDCTSSCSSFCS